MYRRIRFTDPPGPTAERYKVLAIERVDTPKIQVRVWWGQAQRPYANYLFRTVDAREAWIAAEKVKADAHEVRLAERKAARAAVVNPYQVGDILNGSWGYDQTNREFWQVVAVTAKTVVLRELAQASVPGTQGFMSESVEPRPNRFLDKPPRRARIQPGGGVVVGFAYLSKWDGRPKYASWYA